MSEFWRLILVQIVQVSIAATVLTGLAALVVKRRPHLAHLLLLVGLLKCMTPPLLSGPLVVWNTRQQAPLANSNNAFALQAVTTPAPTTVVTESSRPDRTHAALPSQSANLLASTTVRESGRWLVGIIWFGGCLLVLRTAAREKCKAAELWQAYELPVSDELVQLCEQISKRLGFDRSPQVIVNSAGYGPLVSGWLNPVVVLPECLVKDTGARELELAVAHELIHVRRGDTLVSGLQAIVRAVWWFHPLVWWMNRSIDRACELCCDDEVIVSLDCAPVRYAKCLLGILEQKSELRHVVALPGTRPMQVTTTRLARLGRPASEFARYARWRHWLLFTIIAMLLIPAQPLASSPQDASATAEGSSTSNSDESDETQARYRLAAAAFESEDWKSAIVQYRNLTMIDSSDALVWHRLGYALHASGQLDEAMKVHRKLAGFPQGRANALYNIACVHAMQGRPDEAITALEKSIDAGFRADAETIHGDSDLASILNHPRLAELVKRAAEKGLREKYRELDFMVGTWKVNNAQGKYLGRSVITSDERGFLITEKWEAANGSTGTGITYFDPKSGLWRQTFVGMFGNLAHMEGQLDGESLQMSGESILPNRVSTLSQSTTTPLADGSFRFEMKDSSDEGKSWKTAFDGVYSLESE